MTKKFFVKDVLLWNKDRVKDGFTHVVGEVKCGHETVFAYCFDRQQAERVRTAVEAMEASQAKVTETLDNFKKAIVDFSAVELDILRRDIKDLQIC